MNKLKDSILWVAIVAMCITGMIIPDSNASFFNEWYLVFFIALAVYIVIMIRKEKDNDKE